MKVRLRTRTVAIGAAVAAGVIALAFWSAGFHAGTSPVSATNQQIPEASRLGDGVREVMDMLAKVMAGADGSPASIDIRKRRTVALFAQVRNVEQLIPRETFDVDAVVAKVGRDPVHLHDWIRRNTSWVPYAGVLRGARGTLMDRRGNSLDRALLLAQLLASVEVPVRLARAELTPEQAARLKSQPDPPAVRLADPGGLPGAVQSALDNYAKDTGSDAELIGRHFRETQDLSRVAGENLRRRTEIQAAMLARSLAIRPAELADHSAELGSVADHWWVQWQKDSGWSDLDPALPTAGQAIVAAQDTMAIDAVPVDLHHVLHMRVVVEKWDGSKLEEQTAVSVEARPSEMPGETIRLQHVPMAWPAPADLRVNDIQQQFRDAALSQHEWLPVLSVGTKRISAASILDTGDLNQHPGTKQPVTPTRDMLDALSGGGPTSPSMLTAEWLEYEIRSPGNPPRIIRREVFDLVGQDRRVAGGGPGQMTEGQHLSRALSLLGETEVLPVPCQLSAAFNAHLATSRLLAAEPVLTALIDGNAQPEQIRDAQPFPGPLHDLAVVRHAASRNADNLYLRSLNLFSRHAFPMLAPDGTLKMAWAIDIVANEVASTAALSREQFAARLEQGVLDANLEAALVNPQAQAETTADRFGLSDSSRRWITVRTEEDLAKLTLPAETRARIREDVRAGYVVLAPPAERDLHAVWWRVNPRTGDTISFGHRGWGQAMTEYKVMAGGIGVAGVCLFGASLDGRLSNREQIVCGSAGGAVGSAGIFMGGVAIGGFIGGALAAYAGLVVFVFAAYLVYGLLMDDF